MTIILDEKKLHRGAAILAGVLADVSPSADTPQGWALVDTVMDDYASHIAWAMNGRYDFVFEAVPLLSHKELAAASPPIPMLLGVPFGSATLQEASVFSDDMLKRDLSSTPKKAKKVLGEYQPRAAVVAQGEVGTYLVLGPKSSKGALVLGWVLGRDAAKAYTGRTLASFELHDSSDRVVLGVAMASLENPVRHLALDLGTKGRKVMIEKALAAIDASATEVLGTAFASEAGATLADKARANLQFVVLGD